MAKKPNRQAEPLAGAYVLKRGKISDWAPNHPFAHEQISFVPNQESSSSSSPAKQKSQESKASPDPMLPAMDRMEQALHEMAKKFGGTEPQRPDQSAAKESTTPSANGKA